MTALHVVGIDPGMVDTGVVRMSFYPAVKRISISFIVLDKAAFDTDPGAISTWVRKEAPGKVHVFIEKYVPRPGMKSNARMVEMEHILKGVLPGAVLVPNMGVKQVITTELMALLEVWKFPKTTHHQDLRSAARIGLFGMAKEAAPNRVLAQYVMDHTDGTPWAIDHL